MLLRKGYNLGSFVTSRHFRLYWHDIGLMSLNFFSFGLGTYLPGPNLSNLCLQHIRGIRAY